MKSVEFVKYVSRNSLVFSFLLSFLLVTECISSAKVRQKAWADSRVDTVINSDPVLTI